MPFPIGENRGIDKDSRPLPVFPVIMVVTMAALGWMSLSDKGTQRVADPRNASSVASAEQTVVARLWEDPLQAIQAQIATLEKKGTTFLRIFDENHNARAVSEEVRKMAVGREGVCLLVVPIPDTPFPNDLETRLRMRYSIQMALAEESYAPDDRDHLGYFKFSATPIFEHNGEPSASPYIPYEWFVSRSLAQERKKIAVLVLWLPETFLNGRDRTPLSLLAKLGGDLCAGLDGKEGDQLAGLFMIGPRSSDTLKKMVAEHGKPGPAGKADEQALALLRNKLSIFSPQATTPDWLIGLEPQREWKKAREDLAVKLQRVFEPVGKPSDWRYFHNFIAPDDQLTDLLVVELGLRGFNFSPGTTDKILVLAEADTSYGRSLPVALQASINSHRESNIDAGENGAPPTGSGTSLTIKSLNGRDASDSPLRIYHYLRGLDQQKGQEGISKEPQRANAKTPEELLSAVLTREGHMALGESQLDYAERLAIDIKEGPDAKSIKAIAVLGTDIYDKLILLRSLRPKFPGAIVFTTDLDARLWHPDHLSFTRNMVVASAYGINTDQVAPGRIGQSDNLSSATIAPFRDVYQHAIFRACRAALQKAVSPGPIASIPSPRLFEIGENGPITLSPGGRGLAFSTVLSRGMGVLKLWMMEHRFLFISIFVLSVLSLIKIVLNYKKYSIHFVNRGVLITVATGGLGVVAAGYVARFLGSLPGGEPWAWNQGVSVWPTELLRLVICLGVITFLFWAQKSFTSSLKHLEKNYSFGDKAASTARPLQGIFQPWPEKGAEPTSSMIEATAVFASYLNGASVKKRAGRVLCVAGLYFALTLAVAWSGLYTPHIRGGGYARTIDTVMFAASTFLFVVVLFYVLDAVYLLAQLLRGISGPATLWPPRLVERIEQRYRIGGCDVSGYLDVKFAAETSRKIGRLLFFPFAFQLVFILERNRFFDNWTWPPPLIGIFVCNILISVGAWLILRGAARKIREEALERLELALDGLEMTSSDPVPSHSSIGSTIAFGANLKSASTFPTEAEEFTTGNAQRSEKMEKEKPVTNPEIMEVSVSNKTLEAASSRLPTKRYAFSIVKRLIERERGGAYAPFFQDPAVVATFLPSGVFAILFVLLRTLFAA